MTFYTEKFNGVDEGADNPPNPFDDLKNVPFAGTEDADLDKKLVKEFFDYFDSMETKYDVMKEPRREQWDNPYIEDIAQGNYKNSHTENSDKKTY